MSKEGGKDAANRWPLACAPAVAAATPEEERTHGCIPTRAQGNPRTPSKLSTPTWALRPFPARREEGGKAQSGAGRPLETLNEPGVPS